MPVAFDEAVAEPLLGWQRGVVYVLPETRSVHTLFGKLDPDFAMR